MAIPVRYEEIRDRIGTGDCIGVRSRRGVLAQLTRLITRDPHTHTAVVVRVAGRVLCIEQKAAGAVATPLSQLVRANIPFDVYECPVERQTAGVEAWEAIGSQIHYDVADLFRIAANRLLGWPLPATDDERRICSALTLSIYHQSGWRVPSSMPAIPAPADICRALTHRFLVKGESS